MLNAEPHSSVLLMRDRVLGVDVALKTCSYLNLVSRLQNESENC
jgi:hypothetical protein